MTFESVCVVGAGRVGRAVAARLSQQLPTRLTGRELELADADLVICAVPDRTIGEVARLIPPGPWVAHTCGGRRLDALEPHRRRFSLHPLQTFALERGPEQLDGAWAAVSGESQAAVEAGFELAGLLGVHAFVLDDAERPLYHAGAVMASGFLATLHDAAAELLEAAGAPAEALEPLMRRTVENHFAPTGPIVRGDWETVETHLETIRSRRPELAPLYRALVDATNTLALR